MGYQLLANAVLVAHLAFIVFAVVGGLLCLRFRWLVWLHAPAFLWATLVSINNWTCPLTPLENYFLAQAGRDTYEHDFIAQYLLPLIYPEGLTPFARILIGVFVLVVNAMVYAWLIARWRKR